MRRAEPRVLYLTTRGRRSGRPREIEIWFTRRGGCYYLVAEHGAHAEWVRNLRIEPAVEVRVGGRRLAARARVVDGVAEPALSGAIQRRSKKKYGWGDGLVVELRPV